MGKTEILKHKASPGCSMFSYNLETKEIEFVTTVFFTPNEMKHGTVKYYLIPRQEGKIYVQSHNPFEARKRIELFLLKYNKNENQIKSSQELPQP